MKATEKLNAIECSSRERYASNLKIESIQSINNKFSFTYSCHCHIFIDWKLIDFQKQRNKLVNLFMIPCGHLGDLVATKKNSISSDNKSNGDISYGNQQMAFVLFLSLLHFHIVTVCCGFLWQNPIHSIASHYSQSNIWANAPGTRLAIALRK